MILVHLAANTSCDKVSMEVNGPVLGPREIDCSSLEERTLALPGFGSTADWRDSRFLHNTFEKLPT